MVWSECVRTAATVVATMYCFTAVHMSCTGVLLIMYWLQRSRTQDERRRALSSLFLCFFSLFFVLCFGWGSGLMGAWVMYCLQQQLDSRWVGSSPLFSPFVFFSIRFPFFVLGWVRGLNYCCCAYSPIFHSIPKIYLFLALQVTRRVAYLFFVTTYLRLKIPRKIQVTSVQP